MRTANSFPVFHVFTWAPSPVAPTGRSEEFMDLGGLADAHTLEAVVTALAQFIADKSADGYVTVRNVLPLSRIAP